MKKVLILFLLCFSLHLNGQEKHKIIASDYKNQKVEMADAFREDGKIYVVVAVAFIILSGLLGYALYTEKRLTRLEKEFENNQNL